MILSINATIFWSSNFIPKNFLRNDWYVISPDTRLIEVKYRLPWDVPGSHVTTNFISLRDREFSIRRNNSDERSNERYLPWYISPFFFFIFFPAHILSKKERFLYSSNSISIEKHFTFRRNHSQGFLRNDFSFSPLFSNNRNRKESPVDISTSTKKRKKEKPRYLQGHSSNAYSSINSPFRSPWRCSREIANSSKFGIRWQRRFKILTLRGCQALSELERSRAGVAWSCERFASS